MAAYARTYVTFTDPDKYTELRESTERMAREDFHHRMGRDAEVERWAFQAGYTADDEHGETVTIPDHWAFMLEVTIPEGEE